MLAANPAYPGPKHLGPELERLRREGVRADTPWLDDCLGCHRCDLACPNQVGVSELIARAKAARPRSGFKRLREAMFARPGLLGEMAAIAPGLANMALSIRAVRSAMRHALAITDQRPFPRYARPLKAHAPRESREGPRVVFFPGCQIRYNQPETGRDTMSLLELAGFAPSLAATGCCGTPAEANGEKEAARKAALAVLDALEGEVENGALVVAACSSCAHRLKSCFGTALDGDDTALARARALARNTYDLGELLAELGRKLPPPARPGPGLRLAYHAPCHLLSQGIGRPWYHLLRAMPGVEIVDLAAGCCGMSGSFGFKDEKYPLSVAVGSRLFEAVAKAGPDIVVSECAACRMQIQSQTGAAVRHPAEILLSITAGDAGGHFDISLSAPTFEPTDQSR